MLKNTSQLKLSYQGNHQSLTLKFKIKTLIKDKSEAYNNFKESGTTADLITYKKLSKKVKKAIHKDESEWIESELQPDTPAKIAWSKNTEILGDSDYFSPKAIDINDETITNLKKIHKVYAKFNLYDRLHR